MLEEFRSQQGATRIAQETGRSKRARFTSYLQKVVGSFEEMHPDLDVRDMVVVVSGMVSSAHGWQELPYAAVPFSLDGEDLIYQPIQLSRPDASEQLVYLISGIRAKEDVLRVEEMEILGLFSDPAWASHARRCRLILPGTHSKHVEIRDNKIVDFSTSMTGELYDVLTKHSVLKFSVASSISENAGWTEITEGARSAFREGVIMAQQGGLSRLLFSVRTRTLLGMASGEENAFYLSGLLIGTEIRDLLTRDSRGPFLLASSAALGSLYREAFRVCTLQNDLEIVPANDVDNLSIWGHALFLRWIGA